MKEKLKSWAKETFCKKTIKIEELERNLMDKEIELERLRRRFRRLGNQIETMEADGKIKSIGSEIEINAESYGSYVAISMGTNEEYAERLVDEAKERLAEKIAAGIIENDLAQFIVREQSQYDPLSKYTTVAAKLFIVPWEQMTTGRNIMIPIRQR